MNKTQETTYLCSIPTYGQCIQCHRCYVLNSKAGSINDHERLQQIYVPILEQYIKKYEKELDLSQDETMIFMREFIEKCTDKYDINGPLSFFEFFKFKLNKLQIVVVNEQTTTPNQIIIPDQKEFDTVGPLFNVLNLIEKRIFYMRYFQNESIHGISKRLDKTTDYVVQSLNSATDKLNNYY